MKLYGNKITKLIKVDLDDLSVKLRFSDGYSAKIFLDPIFSKPKKLSAEVLKGNLFERCFIESGNLAWSNGFELCPDMLRRLAEEQRKSSARPHKVAA